MRNFLVCMTAESESSSEVQFSFKLFRVKTKDPEEVATPKNTIIFTFIESEDEETLLEELTYFKMIDILILPECMRNAEKIYLMGNLIKDEEGNQFCYNDITKTILTVEEGVQVIPED